MNLYSPILSPQVQIQYMLLLLMLPDKIFQFSPYGWYILGLVFLTVICVTESHPNSMFTSYYFAYWSTVMKISILWCHILNPRILTTLWVVALQMCNTLQSIISVFWRSLHFLDNYLHRRAPKKKKDLIVIKKTTLDDRVSEKKE